MVVLHLGLGSSACEDEVPALSEGYYRTPLNSVAQMKVMLSVALETT